MTLPFPAQVLHLRTLRSKWMTQLDAMYSRCLHVGEHAWKHLRTLDDHSASTAGPALLDITVRHGA